MTNSQQSEALPITNMLEERIGGSVSINVFIKSILPQVRQLETEHVANVSRAKEEERQRVVEILEELLSDADKRVFQSKHKKFYDRKIQEAIERISNNQ